MRITASVSSSVLSAVLALGGIAVPAGAGAQAVPSYAQPDRNARQETIHGVIASVDGAWHITLADDRGFNDAVDLTPGTILAPRGLQLSAGMEVTIVGYNGGATFVAVEIDTPYESEAPPPEAVYYGEGWWYPGYDYGYAPAFLLGIGIGIGVGGYGFGGGGVVIVRRPFVGRPPPRCVGCDGTDHRFPLGDQRRAAVPPNGAYRSPQSYRAPEGSRDAAPRASEVRSAPSSSGSSHHG